MQYKNVDKLQHTPLTNKYNQLIFNIKIILPNYFEQKYTCLFLDRYKLILCLYYIFSTLFMTVGIIHIKVKFTSVILTIALIWYAS